MKRPYRNYCDSLLFSFLILLAVLQVGAIRKKSDQDPIRLTQTDPITYKDKMEELKDGEKGAPSPSMKFYSDYDVQTASSVKTNQEEQNVGKKEENPDNGLIDEGEVKGLGKESQESEDWWLDSPSETNTASEDTEKS